MGENVEKTRYKIPESSLMESHSMCLIVPGMSCDNTCEMGSSLKSVSRVFFFIEDWSLSPCLEFQTARRKAGV